MSVFKAVAQQGMPTLLHPLPPLVLPVSLRNLFRRRANDERIEGKSRCQSPHYAKATTDISLAWHLVFHCFLRLPRELRDLVYEAIIADTTISVKGQPRSRNSFALLRASRQMKHEFGEACARSAVLTVHLEPQYARYKDRDAIYAMDHHIAEGEQFDGPLGVLQTAPRVHLKLGPQIKPNWLMFYPVISTTLRAMPAGTTVTASIDIGTVRPLKSYNKSLNGNFDAIYQLTFTQISPRMAELAKTRSELSDVQLKARGTGTRFRARWSEAARQDILFLDALQTVAWYGKIRGARVWLESADRSVRKEVLCDHVAGLVDVAAGMGKGVKLVLESHGRGDTK